MNVVFSFGVCFATAEGGRGGNAIGFLWGAEGGAFSAQIIVLLPFF